jgi:radical SAM protein (TIGR01212 family)
MKRYRDYNSYLREIFGERVQKIALDAGLGCPNRDGTISDRGCAFCDPLGSGTGAWINEALTISEQIARAKKYYRTRYGARKFIAYFQSFTNTYAPLSHLKALYEEALVPEDVVGLSLGTRPDCVDGDVLELLAQYDGRTLVWIEYGLQSAQDATLSRINRGHDRASFEDAVLLTHQYGLNICAHVILGLPGEDREMMMQTARFVAGLPIQGIKIHLLYVVEGTPLAGPYKRGEFRCLERDEYAELVTDFLERLPPTMVVQRLTGDPGKAELVAPLWAKEKAINLKVIHETLERRDTWQGRIYRRSAAGKSRQGI